MNQGSKIAKNEKLIPDSHIFNMTFTTLNRRTVNNSTEISFRDHFQALNWNEELKQLGLQITLILQLVKKKSLSFMFMQLNGHDLFRVGIYLPRKFCYSKWKF